MLAFRILSGKCCQARGISREVEDELWRIICWFFATGAMTTITMLGGADATGQRENVAAQEVFRHGRDLCELLRETDGLEDMITVEPKMFPSKEDGEPQVEHYEIIRLVGDWEAVKGDAWIPRVGKTESVAPRGRNRREPPRKRWSEVQGAEDILLDNGAVKDIWSDAERSTVISTFLFIAMKTFRSKVARRPAPSRASKIGKDWEWAVVMDSQTKHDDASVKRALLLIDVLDENKLLPKIMIDTDSWQNLRAPAGLLQEFGNNSMAVDSIEELASYSVRQVLLLLLGVLIACAVGWILETGVGFFLLALLCASSLEQEISFRLFQFALERPFRPPQARPAPGSLANYLMIAAFGLVEAGFDEDRIPLLLPKWGAVVVTSCIVVLALPPLMLVVWARSKSEYKGPYPLSSPERQDWVRNSVGYFYGSCRESVMGGAGRGYRCGDQAGGRLLSWFAACNDRGSGIIWTGTGAGGVHHSVAPELTNSDTACMPDWWVVVG